MHWELEPTQFTLRLYEGDGVKYAAVATIRTNGDRGWISGLNGAGFYDLVLQHIDAILTKAGVAVIEGYVTPTHARLIKRRLKDRVTLGAEGECAGRTMVWVTIRRLPNP